MSSSGDELSQPTKCKKKQQAFVDDDSPREQHSSLIENCMNLIVASSGSELSNE